MRIRALILATLALTGCIAVDPILPSADGYDAIEFTRVTLVRDHALNMYTFPAGRRFIADRRARDGSSLYCGLLTINGDPRPFDACIGFEAPNTLVLAPGVPLKEVRRPQPEGVVKRIKAKI
ncbi:hypothetical protein [Sinorhizobium sp. 22678]|uniref:hypothetical protein n=1 Tax=Sinorhizobium sp. 22678 TaxID=3453955 RepID=UPI003F866401